MLGSVEPTQYDLRFSVLNIPVRVSIWFWLAGTVLGFETLKIGVEYLMAWLLVVFVSILVHELGHALIARSFGYPPRILLYQFGGLAMYTPYSNYTQARSIAISLAGPGAGFLLFGAVLLFQGYGAPHLVPVLSDSMGMLLIFFLKNMVWVNLFWGLLNLLPILPLDGGNVCKEVCRSLSPLNGPRYAYGVGMVVGIAAAVLLYRAGLTYAAVLFGFLGVENFMNLQASRNRW